MNEASLFAAALEQANAEDRSAYLTRACAGDARLRRRVEALLRAHAEPDELLDPPLTPTVDAPLVAERPGTIIGPYKLLEQIGEGGMGLVFVAEQQHPVRRRVAVKIIKPGMDSRQVIARFEAERQALAMMDHTNIAKVYDAGTTDSGQPYFVMELVHGVSITEYCDANKLTPRQRLELFVPVCQAIQHAHQKGVIHRDVKPSNVLVTMYDDKPVPKVIDFGVAKAIEQRLTEKTVYTQFGTLVGTFEYMSPEQAEMNAFGVDTRSDVYSLGVLLYELLTGSTPLERLRLREAAFGEIVRLIKEEEAPRPSVRLSTSGALAKVAAARKTEPGKLSRLVRGELDWVVMKCLEKDRTRRYETANGLARDVERYLRNEAVEACPPSAAYKVQKLFRRNRTAVVTTAVVAAALVLGTVVSTWQAIRATRSERLAANRLVELQEERDRVSSERDRAMKAEQKAKHEAAVAKAVNDFLQKDLLAQASPDNEPDRDLKLRTLLDRAAQKIDGKFDQQPLVEAAIRQTIASTYVSLSLFAAAQPHLERVVELRSRHQGEEHRMTLIATQTLVVVLREQFKYAEAEALCRKLLDLRSRVLGEEDPDTANTMTTLAIILHIRQSKGKLAEAETLARKALAVNRRVLGEEHNRTLECMSVLTGVLQRQGKVSPAEAEEAARKILKTHRRVKGNESPETLLAVHALALLLLEQDKLDEAERLCREGLEPARRVLGDEHLRTLLLMTVLGRVLHAQGDYAAAEPLFAKNLEGRRRGSGEERLHTGIAMGHLAELYKDQGKYDQAEPLAVHALAILRRDLGEEHGWPWWLMTILAEVYQGQGKYDRAEPLLVKVVELSRRVGGPEHPKLALGLALLGSGRLRQQKFTEAEPVLRECLAICEKSTPDGWPLFNAKWLLGGALLGQKKHAEAEPLLLAGYEGLKQRQATLPPPLRDRPIKALQALVQLYDTWGKPDEAAKWRKELEARKSAEKKP